MKVTIAKSLSSLDNRLYSNFNDEDYEKVDSIVRETDIRGLGNKKIDKFAEKIFYSRKNE